MATNTVLVIGAGGSGKTTLLRNGWHLRPEPAQCSTPDDGLLWRDGLLIFLSMLSLPYIKTFPKNIPVIYLIDGSDPHSVEDVDKYLRKMANHTSRICVLWNNKGSYPYEPHADSYKFKERPECIEFAECEAKYAPPIIELFPSMFNTVPVPALRPYVPKDAPREA